MMLSLTQRLILGCAALAGLMLWLALATRGAIAAAGHRTLAIALPAAAIVLAILTIVAVLAPLRTLASDAHKIAQGNLDHRSAWAGRDSAGVLAAEINRLAVRLRE